MPQTFISYSHDSIAHSKLAADLSDRLRCEGIDCEIDQYEISPPEGWSAWSERMIREAIVVLVICTAGYLRRYEGREPPKVGLGVKWESMILRQHIYLAGSHNVKFIAVLFQPADEAYIPLPLCDSTRICLAETNGFSELCDRIRGVATHRRPPVGTPLPERARYPEFFAETQNNFVEAGIIRNRDFVGRDQFLSDLASRLVTGREVALIHSLCAGGGVGKTQIAIEFAYRFHGDFVGIWWLDATHAGLDTSVASLAKKLRIILPPEAQPKEICTAVAVHLRSAKHLLILDNLDDVGRLADFPIAGGRTRLLITTRHTNLPHSIVESLDVDLLSITEARDLLRRHRRFDLADDTHNCALDAISEHLGYHALAIALAGAYLAEFPNVSPETLLERLILGELGTPSDILEDPELREVIGGGYWRSVAETLAMHFEDLRGKDEEQVLHLVAFCHATAIPLDLVCDTADAARWELPRVERAARGLNRLSIIRYQESLSIHRLTQSVVRGRLAKSDAVNVLIRLLKALGERMKDAADVKAMNRIEHISTHAQEVISHAIRYGITEDVGKVAKRLGLFLRNRARLAAAGEAFRASEDADRKVFGDNHQYVATDVSLIGSVLLDQGDHDGAWRQFKKARRINRHVFGAEHPNVARDLNDIGYTLYVNRRFDCALRCFREAERIARKSFGSQPSHYIALYVRNIGRALRALGDVDGALNYLHMAERIHRQVDGDDHPDVAWVINDIGDALLARGDADDLKHALHCYQVAAEMNRRWFGSDHPNVARNVLHIGDVVRKMGDSAGARKCYCEAFPIALRHSGPRARLTIRSSERLLAYSIDPVSWAEELEGKEVADSLLMALREARLLPQAVRTVRV